MCEKIQKWRIRKMDIPKTEAIDLSDFFDDEEEEVELSEEENEVIEEIKMEALRHFHKHSVLQARLINLLLKERVKRQEEDDEDGEETEEKTSDEDYKVEKEEKENDGWRDDNWV